MAFATHPPPYRHSHAHPDCEKYGCRQSGKLSEGDRNVAASWSGEWGSASPRRKVWVTHQLPLLADTNVARCKPRRVSLSLSFFLSISLPSKELGNSQGTLSVGRFECIILLLHFPKFRDRSLKCINRRVDCTHEAEWTPLQTRYFSENLVPLGIEPGSLDLGNLTTTPQRRSHHSRGYNELLSSGTSI
jgi:hypothetical protein